MPILLPIVQIALWHRNVMISTVVFGRNPMASAFASMSTNHHARSSNGALATTATSIEAVDHGRG